jgi:hypothetical protein
MRTRSIFFELAGKQDKKKMPSSWSRRPFDTRRSEWNVFVGRLFGARRHCGRFRLGAGESLHGVGAHAPEDTASQPCPSWTCRSRARTRGHECPSSRTWSLGECPRWTRRARRGVTRFWLATRRSSPSKIVAWRRTARVKFAPLPRPLRFSGSLDTVSRRALHSVRAQETLREEPGKQKSRSSRARELSRSRA